MKQTVEQAAIAFANKYRTGFDKRVNARQQ